MKIIDILRDKCSRPCHAPVILFILALLLSPEIVSGGVPSACPCGPVGGSSSYSYTSYRLPSAYVAQPKPKVYTKTPAQKRRAKRRESARKKAEKQLKREVIRASLEDAASVSVKYDDVKKVIGTVALGHDRERYILFNEKRTRGKKTETTEKPTERLRRSLGIMRSMFNKKGKFRQDMSSEDIKFMGDQAGLAMAGAPLEVYVSPTHESWLTKTQVKELNEAIQRVEESSARANRLTEQRVEIEKKLLRARFGPVDDSLSISERIAKSKYPKLKKEYEEIVKEETKAHEDAAEGKKRAKKVIKKALNFEVSLD